jgi:hypothetical protein
MKQHHPMLWAAGWAGLAVGVALAAMGMMGGNDVLNLAGLKLRETLARRTRPAHIPAARHTVSQTLTQR